MRLIFFVCLIINFTAYSGVKEDINSQHELAYTLLHTNPDQALEIAVTTEKLSNDANLPLEEANSIFIKAWILKEKKIELGKAFVSYLKALEIIKQNYNESETGTKLYIDLLINTAIILTEHSALNEALEYYDEAFKVATSYDRKKDLILISWNKASLLNELGKTELAIIEIELAIENAISINDQKLLANALNDRGLYLIELKDFDAARDSFDQILKLNLNKERKNFMLGRVWHNIGHSFGSENKHQDAISAYKKAEQFKINGVEIYPKYKTWLNLSESYLNVGNYSLALEFGLKSLELYPEIQLLPENYSIFEHLSSIAFDQGDYAKSREYSEKYISENKKFLELQEEIQRTKDQYKMEVLAAGFFLEINSEKNESLYSLLLTIVSSLFTIALLAGITGQYWVRRSIRKSIQDLEKDSFV